MQYKRHKFIFIFFFKYTSLLHDLRMLRVSFLWMQNKESIADSSCYKQNRKGKRKRSKIRKRWRQKTAQNHPMMILCDISGFIVFIQNSSNSRGMKSLYSIMYCQNAYRLKLITGETSTLLAPVGSTVIGVQTETEMY